MAKTLSFRSVAYFGVHTSYHSLLCVGRKCSKAGHVDEIDVCLGNELVRYRLQNTSSTSASFSSSLFPQRVLERVSHRKMHDAVVSDCVRSPCARNLFATCSYDDRLRVWTETGNGNYQLLACVSCNNAARALVVDQLCWSACGTRLVSTTRVTSGRPRGRMQVWSFEEGKLSEVTSLDGSFQKALFNNDGNILAFLRQENTVSLYALENDTLRQLGTLTLPASSSSLGVSAFAMSPTLSTLVCCTKTKTGRLFHLDARNLTILSERPSKALRNVGCMTMLDEHHVIYSPANGRLVVVRLDNGHEEILPGPPQGVIVLTLTADRSRIVSATVDGLYVQFLPSSTTTHSSSPLSSSPPPPRRNSLLSRLLPTRTTHALELDSKDQGFFVNESKHNGNTEAHVGGVQFHTVAGCGIDVSSDGNFLASGDLGCKVVIWDLTHHSNESKSSSSSSCSRSSSSGSSSSSSPHDQFAPFAVHQLGVGVRSLKWLPSSHTVLVGCLDGQLLRATINPITRVVKSSCIHRSKAAINCIEIRPARSDGETHAVAVDSAGNATLLNVSSRTCNVVHEWLAHPPVHSTDPAYRLQFGSIHRAADVWSCIWSPDGSLLATCSEDQSTRIWDMRGEPRLLQILTGHKLAVTCLDWVVHENDTLLATCADDQCVMLWETRSPPLGYCEAADSGSTTCTTDAVPICRLRHVFTAQAITTDVPGWFTFTYMRFVGTHLVVGTENGWVLVLDIGTNCVIHARCIHRGSIEGLCYHSTGHVATISSDCSIALHNLLHDSLHVDDYGHSQL